MEILVYLLKSTTILSLFFMIYEFGLKSSTHFKENRIFLLGGMILAPLLPLIYWTQTKIIEIAPTYISSSASSADETATYISVTPSGFWENTSWQEMIMGLYGITVLFFVFRFLFQLFKLKKILKQQPQENEAGICYIKTTEKVNPFSFFKTVIYNPEMHDDKELELILKHEQAHVQQLHSIDVLLTNLITFIYWFNPLAWGYSKRVTQNLEFLADQAVTQDMDSIAPYQRSLLSCIIPKHGTLPVNNYHNSFLKKRIKKLHQPKSKKTILWRPLLILPLLLLFFYSFQIQVNTKYINIPQQERAANTAKDHLAIDYTQINDYLDQHSTVILNGKEIATISLKNTFYKRSQFSFTEEGLLKIDGDSHKNEELIAAIADNMDGEKYIFFKEGEGKMIALAFQGHGKSFTYKKKTSHTPSSSPTVSSLIVSVKDDSAAVREIYRTYTIKDSYTPKQLEELKNTMKKAGIHFIYSHLKYNKAHRLIRAKFRFTDQHGKQYKYAQSGGKPLEEIRIIISDSFTGFQTRASSDNYKGLQLKGGNITYTTLSHEDTLTTDKAAKNNPTYYIPKTDSGVSVYQVPANAILALQKKRGEQREQLINHRKTIEKARNEIAQKRKEILEKRDDVQKEVKKTRSTIIENYREQQQQIKETRAQIAKERAALKTAQNYRDLPLIVSINKKMTAQDLNQIRKNLKEKGIDFDFKISNRNAKKEITKIKLGAVDSKNKSKVAVVNSNGINPITLREGENGVIFVTDNSIEVEK